MEPAATMRLMDEGYWGAKAMARRVQRCCAANPVCPIGEQCNARYDKFVDGREPPDKRKWPSYQKSKVDRSANYHLLRAHGINSGVAARNMSNRATAAILAIQAGTTTS